MGSTVRFDDHRSSKIQHGKLVYPDDVSCHHSVSVLSVLGVALLGLGTGQSMTWIDTADEQQIITVLEIASRATESKV